MKIYFDTCCYGRFRDDQDDPRIAAETADIAAIIKTAKQGGVSIVGGWPVAFELGNIRDFALRADIVKIYDDTICENRSLTDADIKRAKALQAEGVGAMDSRHLAVAEAAGVDFLITTDKDFEDIVTKKNLSGVKVVKPSIYLARGIK